jgi:exopolysaccharide biosynthesis polyprenyl glycosylphosphotransferase
VGALSEVRRAVAYRSISNGQLTRTGYILIDLFFVSVNACVVFVVRFLPDWRAGSVYEISHRLHRLPLPADYLGFLLVYGLLTVVFCENQSLYSITRTRSKLGEFFAVQRAVILATLLLTAFIYLSKIEISRLVVVISALLNIAALAGWRLWARRRIARRVTEGHGVRNVLIVGAGKVGQQLARYLDANKHLGYAVKGFLDQKQSSNPRLLGKVEDLARVARAQFADEVFVTIPAYRELVKRVAAEGRENRLDVRVIPDLYDGLGWQAPVEHLGDFPVISLHREPIPALGLLIKRITDITISLAALILFAPLAGVIAIAIKLDSPGGVFYRGVRVGKKGKRFNCLKFRTMVAEADALKGQLRHLNERHGPIFKIANDPRLTRVGRFLRKYSLDELPQFWNVLKGEMSLVGPRPHPTDDFNQYTLEHLRRLDVTPGLTGLWQVTARHDPSFERSMALDLEYIDHWNLWFDIEILLKTVPAVLSGTGT